jgi:trimeric autotransporter adhesin
MTENAKESDMRKTLTTIIFVVLIGMTPSLFGQESAASFPAPAEAQISGVMGEDDPAYHVVPQPEGFRMKNANHGLSVELTPDGIDFHQGPREWGMVLRGYGYGETLQAAGTLKPRAHANRVEYRRGALTEWYVNGPFGIEQGFTLESAPGKAQNEPLTFALALSGDLNASIDARGRGLTLKKDGIEVLRYGGLLAFDARGRDLPAWLELADNHLRIRIDDANAEYPIVVDPYTQAAKLTNNLSCIVVGFALAGAASSCEQGSAGDRFGRSVSVSGDGNTIVVGAPHATGVTQPATGDSHSGAAYVFVKPTYGWGSCFVIGCGNYVAKLTPTAGSPGFGEMVSISSDGNTIAVLLATQSDFGSGLVYVYAKPASGWRTSTETALLSLNGINESPCFQGLNPIYCSTVFWSSIAISGDGSAIVLGYSGGRVGTIAPGAVYVFVRPATGWARSFSPVKLTASDGADFDLLGMAVSISSDGTTIAAAADQANHWQGAVYVFVKPAGGWTNATQTAKLTRSTGQFLGNSVAISGNGDTVVAGAEGKGIVFVEPARFICILNGGCFLLQAWRNTTETAALSASGDSLGRVAISADGNTIAGAGLNNLTSFTTGLAYVYAKPPSGWISSYESTKFMASDGTTGNLFGTSISLSADGSLVAVGAPGATIGSNVGQGAAYVFGGSPGAAVATVAPTSLTFGPQATGTSSLTQPVTVTNTGTAFLTVTGVSASGPFTTTQNCVAASPIAPNGTCQENVTFAPASVGAVNGVLTFTDNGGGATGPTQQVQLSGTGIKASTSVAISSVVFNPAIVGEPVKISFVVTPQSGVTLTPSGTVTLTASTGESCTGAAPSGFCSITFATATNRTVEATYNGDANFNPSASASVVVRVTDFTLVASVSAERGAITLTVTGVNGFKGIVALGCTGPSGTTCTISPTSVNISAATPTATATATVTLPIFFPGTATVTFIAKSGGATRTAPLIVK